MPLDRHKPAEFSMTSDLYVLSCCWNSTVTWELAHPDINEILLGIIVHNLTSSHIKTPVAEKSGDA